MNSTTRRVGRYLTISVWFAVTFFALFPWASHPVSAMQWEDKVQHFLAFSVLASLIGFFWDMRGMRLTFLLLSYGLLIELLQMFIPGHIASFLDMLANLVGIYSGLSILFFVNWVRMTVGMNSTA